MRGTSLFLTVALLAVPAPLAGCAGTQTPAQRAEDDVVSARVAARMTADPDVSKYQIDVDVIDGVATLRGRVPSQMARQEAEELTRNTEGVSEVRNQLTVEDIGMGERIEEGASDAWIRTKIDSKMAADPEVARWRIDVDVIDGVVTLSGTVDNMVQKQEAEELARRTEGVKEVRNELKVRGMEEGMTTPMEHEHQMEGETMPETQRPSDMPPPRPTP